MPFCTITTISESPLKAGTIWVGTDDGKVQVTTNHGGTWTDVTPALVAAGAPVDRWVSRVFASPFDANTAFVSKNGFRNDDFAPYLYRTTDGGKTWTSITANLPKAAINVVVQDRKNKNLLVVGNDIGVFVSIDSGASWSRLKANLPTVSVTDLVIHPREGDLVLGTYGRGFWTGDITPLQELTPEVLDQERAPVRRRAAPALRLQRPGHELPPVRRPVHRGPERARRALDQLLPEGGRSAPARA